jgi:uncharacterized membrane protein YciS (DUF1049 family)
MLSMQEYIRNEKKFSWSTWGPTILSVIITLSLMLIWTIRLEGTVNLKADKESVIRLEEQMKSLSNQIADWKNDNTSQHKDINDKLQKIIDKK